MPEIRRHKVFISYHHDDQVYKDMFVRILTNDVVDKSVHDGDIDDNLKTETIREKIRDEFIADATVTIVLIGPCTWQRKHVDWEIGSSLRATKKNSRCGLLGIILPNHYDHGTKYYRPHLIPPRLADNCADDSSYAKIYDWSDTLNLRSIIHHAFERRKQLLPDNRRAQYHRNRSGPCSAGWKS